ncbi:hypothetical protein [Brevibacillus agri]|uniref:hypothetical protein n=1 Tax=Brevibacillus agri TaxID=51101 RepID=UPI0030F37D1E
MTVRDYEHQLRMEISENENRKEFTFSERVDWARRLERVEKEKARERMEAGKAVDPMQNFAEGRSRDIVAEQSGLGSGENYRKAKYIADHADPEIIAKLDADEISIHRKKSAPATELTPLPGRSPTFYSPFSRAASTLASASMYTAHDPIARIPHSFREFPNRSPAFLRLTTRGRVNVPGRWNNARNGGADRGKRENCGHARWACDPEI